MSAIPDSYEKPYQLQKANVQLVTAPKSFPLRAVIEGHGDVLGPVCRSHGVDPEAVIAQLWMAAQKTPDILKARPASLVASVANAIRSGGVIGRDVDILVFGGEAVDNTRWQYLVELAIACGVCRSIAAELIHEHDEFREFLGSDRRLVHNPPGLGKVRGRIIGVYAIAHFGVSVPPLWVTMTLEQVEAIRAKSKSWGPNKFPQAPDWYVKKTVIRQLCKLLPKNPKWADRMVRVEAAEDAHESPDEIVVSGPLEMAPEPVTQSPRDDAPPSDVSPELARALAYTVKGRTLAELGNDELTKLEQWALDKDNQRVADMCGLVLHSRTTQAAQQALELEPVE